jgi:hypothetical protein
MCFATQTTIIQLRGHPPQTTVCAAIHPTQSGNETGTRLVSRLGWPPLGTKGVLQAQCTRSALTHCSASNVRPLEGHPGPLGEDCIGHFGVLPRAARASCRLSRYPNSAKLNPGARFAGAGGVQSRGHPYRRIVRLPRRDHSASPPHGLVAIDSLGPKPCRPLS